MTKEPDKIYTDGNGKYAEIPLFAYGNHEYIRKDKLLEWVKGTEYKRERVPIEPYNNDDYQAGFIDGFDRFRRRLIDKLYLL